MARSTGTFRCLAIGFATTESQSVTSWAEPEAISYSAKHNGADGRTGIERNHCLNGQLPTAPNKYFGINIRDPVNALRLYRFLRVHSASMVGSFRHSPGRWCVDLRSIYTRAPLPSLPFSSLFLRISLSSSLLISLTPSPPTLSHYGTPHRPLVPAYRYRRPDARRVSLLMMR